MNMVDTLKLKASQGTPQTDEIARMIEEQESKDYVVRCDCGTAYLDVADSSKCPECGY